MNRYWEGRYYNRFEAAALTWLAYQFMGYQLTDNHNKNTQDCIAKIFGISECTSFSVILKRMGFDYN